MENKLLTRIYFLSTSMVALLFTILCFVLHWKLSSILVVLIACSAFCMPLVLGLHVLFAIAKKLQASRLFFWMMLMASIPLLSFLPADFFAEELPGKTSFLILIGILAAYISIFINGNSISHVFNPNPYED